jgi:hypothetical protein
MYLIDKTNPKKAHNRLVYFTFNPEADINLLIHHKDGDTQNNRLDLRSRHHTGNVEASYAADTPHAM